MDDAKVVLRLRPNFNVIAAHQLQDRRRIIARTTARNPHPHTDGYTSGSGSIVGRAEHSLKRLVRQREFRLCRRVVRIA